MNKVKHTTDMIAFNRRRFLQGLVGGTGLSVEVPSVLVDVTRCIGCRACMRACKAENDLPDNTELSAGFPDSWDRQELRFDQWTVVNPQTACNADGIEVTRNVKSQCMQCLEPTCVSVCLVGPGRGTDQVRTWANPLRCRPLHRLSLLHNGLSV
jgi:ferredoxin